MLSNISNRFDRILLASILVSVGIMFISTSVYSEPPPWAPAHGYRDKHKIKHEHKNQLRQGHEYYDQQHGDDIGIFSGRCNYEKVGTIVGAATGAVIGSKVVDKDDQVIGVIAGTVAGLIIGKTIGRAIDEHDRHCAGQALEFAGSGQTVTWHNPNTNIDYKITPVKTYQSDGLDCRFFTTQAKLANGQSSAHESDACLHNDGVWRTVL